MISKKRKFRSTGKKLLSLLLCAAMGISMGQGLTFKASAAKEEAGLVYLDSKRIAKDRLPKGDYLYFGTAAAAVEEHGKYALRIYREGDLDKKVSVDIKAVDMTALYGKDYKFVMDDVKTADDAGEETILQKYAKGKENAESHKEEYTSLYSGENNFGSSVSASDVSTLAKKKEEQTGTKARELTESDTEGQGLFDELTESFLADAINGMDYSATCNVTFEAGEDEKTVKFQVLDDDESEGAEGFCFVLANPEDIELYEVSSASISIKDDEPIERSEISFSKSSYKAKNGKAVLKVKRTGAEYSVCDMTVLTCGDTAKAGKNYTEKNETLAFAPYETEKEIEIDVAGKGSFDVLLTGLKACTQGRHTRAEVSIAQGKKKAGKLLKASSDDTQAFGIIINKRNYTVQYKKGDATGKIMDESYSPPVEAGVYYFSSDEKHGGIFDYGNCFGDKPSLGGNRRSEYIYDEKKPMEQNFGKLEYYSPWVGHKGGASAESSRTIPGAYYQYFVNDWKSKSNFGGGQRAKLAILGKEERTDGDFSRTQDRAAVKNTQDGYVYADVYSYDDSSGMTPKSYVEFYGLCAMYKKFNVSLLPVGELRYRTGMDGSYAEAAPVQVSVKCGAQVLYQNESRDIYANLDEKQSNLVFTISDTYLNGHTGKFGHITGYKITVDAKEADKKKTLNYPEDFITYLNSMKGGSDKNNQNMECVNFSAEAVENEIKKVKANLDTIPYDGYFLYWINSKQDVNDLPSDGYGYKGILNFQPLITYDDVFVDVLPASGKGTGHFTDTRLKKTGNYTFHAGDSLTLDAVADDSDSYYVSGYQYSVDGGVSFNTMTDGSDLFLESGKNYQIRPVISEKYNAIEVQFANDNAASGLEIQGLIGKDELKGTEFEGKNILNLNPSEKTVQDKAKPVPGKDYAVRIAVKKKESGDKVYRPCVKMKSKNTVYKTQCFYMIAASDANDNIIVVDLEAVKKSEIYSYQVVGNLVSEFAPIRSTGLETKKLPVSGYTMVMGTGRQNTDSVSGEALIETAATTTGDTGAYTLMGIYGCKEDMIPILISNGTSNGQVVDVKLNNFVKASDGSSYEINKGNTALAYPYGIPCVTSLSYKYEKSTNNQKSDLRDNSVHIYDDTLTITAKVDTKGRKIKEAVFTVYTVTGLTEEYHVKESEGNKNTFECVITKMTENLHNGDRVSVKLVDSEELFSGSGTSDTGGKVYDDEGNEITGKTVAMEYPNVDTGLVFYVENVLVQPQNFEIENKQAVNVPLLGTTTSNAGSGMITFGKNKWASGNGYTLQVGVDALYSSIMSPTTQQKLNNLSNYHKQVSDAAKPDSKTNAEDIILNQKNAGDEEKTKLVTSNLKEEKSAMEDSVDTLKKDPYSKAKKATAGLNKDAMYNVDIAFLLAFDFVYDPVAQEYIFCCGSVAAGGTFTFSKTHYTNIEGVPVFLNVTGTLQLSGVVAYNTDKGSNALSAGDFDGYAGNLAERLKSTKGIVDIMFSLKVQVGTGMCGVLAARGFVTLKLQYEACMDMDTDGKQGAMIAASGGVGYDLILFSVNIEYGNIRAGWGTLETQPTFGFFGGMVNLPLTEKKKASPALYGAAANGDAVLKTYENGSGLLLHQYSSGTSDMSGFGKNAGLKKATLEAVSVTPVLDGAAEHARPRIISLGGKKKMMVFIGNRGSGDAVNSMALYYSVYDGSKWSTPQIVADDGTVDSTPDIMKKGDKVVIAWADAGRKFTSADINSKTNKLSPFTLSAMNISVAIYDINSGIMGDEVTLVDDGYFNLSPKLNVDGTKVYCSYMKRDVANAKDETDLLDLTKLYSTMAYVTYDFGGEVQEGGKRLSDEKFIEISHSSIKDPLVTDFTSVSVETDGDTYLLSAYTIDEDKNLSTSEDRELYLQVYNTSKDRRYYPIRISNDNVNQSSPKLSSLNGTVYLTWLNEGHLFNILDVSEIMEAFFDTKSKTITITEEDGSGNTVKKDITVGKEKYIDSYMSGENENKDWYRQSAASLGIDETYYEGSLYSDIAEGKFGSDSANFRQNPEVTTSISDYSLVTDGKDIYIFFTDFGSEEGSTGVEIYGVKYQRVVSEKESTSSDGNTETTGFSSEDKWGFGKAVQITDKNKVIDEIDMYMTEDNKISVVSNYYSQWIDVNGNMQYGANQIVEIEFEPKNSLELGDDAITLPVRLVGGEKDKLSFKVKNNGLLAAKGFDYTVSQVTGKDETVISQGHSDDIMESGESISLSMPWSVPNSLSDTSIKVTVTETGVAGSKPVSVTKKLPYESNICFEDTEVILNGNAPYVKTTVINKGNAASKAYSGTLSMVDSDNNEVKTYKKFEIPALASGESKTFELPFTPEADDFSSLGIIDLKLSALDGNDSIKTHYTRLISSSPICAQINGGEKEIKLGIGKTTALKTKAAPWDGAAGGVRFYSSDDAVAVVDNKGVVTGKTKGSAVIYAYYPSVGVTASVDVSVSEQGGGSEPPKASSATKKLTVSKSSTVIAAGKSKSIKFTAKADKSASKAAPVKVSVSGNKKVTAKITGSKVKITVNKKAVKGSAATITLKSKNAAGKYIKAAIKVKVQNKAKKVVAKKKTITVKKGKKIKFVLKVTAQNKKKATTDTVKVSSKLVSLAKKSIKKGKITLTLKGKKKGRKTITVKVGSKKVKVKAKVK